MGLKWQKKSYYCDDRGYSIFDILDMADLPGQLNFSRIDGGVVKAFHLHKSQENFITCLEGSVKFIVAEQNWANMQELTLNALNPVVVHIPKNHWYGYKGLDNGAKILYYCTNKYDDNIPDEQRAPWDYLGRDVWDIEFK